MKTIDDLTTELCTAYETLKDDREYVAQASELANLAGKIINAQKVQLDYAYANGVKPNIKFLGQCTT